MKTKRHCVAQPSKRPWITLLASMKHSETHILSIYFRYPWRLSPGICICEDNARLLIPARTFAIQNNVTINKNNKCPFFSFSHSCSVNKRTFVDLLCCLIPTQASPVGPDWPISPGSRPQAIVVQRYSSDNWQFHRSSIAIFSATRRLLGTRVVSLGCLFDQVHPCDTNP